MHICLFIFSVIAWFSCWAAVEVDVSWFVEGVVLKSIDSREAVVIFTSVTLIMAFIDAFAK
jgi:hypothetical protein